MEKKNKDMDRCTEMSPIRAEDCVKREPITADEPLEERAEMLDDSKRLNKNLQVETDDRGRDERDQSANDLTEIS